MIIVTGAVVKDEMSCFDECKTLTTADYVSLLWTTLAELPGNVAYSKEKENSYDSY